MRKRAFYRLSGLVFVVVLATAACGSDGDDSTFPGAQTNGADGGDGASDYEDGATGSGSFGDDDSGASTKPLASIDIQPKTAVLDLTGAPYPTQQFTLTAHFKDGTTGPVSATWSASEASVGGVSASGLYTPHGQQGGLVTITATVGGQKATTTLTVRLHQVDNPAKLDADAQAGLLAATTPDANVVWTYPYDGMAYPRGLNAPNLMWNKGDASDVYLVRLVSPTYDLQVFTTASTTKTLAGAAPQGAKTFAFDAARWEAFTNSTSGKATLTVARKTGATFTKVVEHTWSVASRSMSGTIYYWAINKAAVVRIKPGAQTPDYFLGKAKVPTDEWSAPNKPSKNMFCPSCHTASADGSKLVMGTGYWGDGADVWSTLYDLKSDTTTFHGYQTSTPPSRFPLAGVTPDGNVLVENWAVVRGVAAGKEDVPLDISAPNASSMTVPQLKATDLDTLVGAGHHTFFPVFSADNELFAYVDSSDANLYSLDWDAKAKKFSNRVLLATAPGNGLKIAYPTISPDHRWVVYQVGPDYGSLDVAYTGDLVAVDTKNPDKPISLDAINKTVSAAAKGNRDPHRSYEPTFAPVASGGYFWLVFHSRRTYGNELVDVAYGTKEGSGTKQLWVAALDVAGGAATTTDPSHPPFWLPGQDPTTRNMRGFWALDPCKADGASCTAGTDCCNGFCDATGDAGGAVCGASSVGCSQVGDRCDSASDCCDAASGVVCINHVCSEPAPPH